MRGRSGLYYSPPGTSYTIVERPHSPHYYYNSAGSVGKTGSLPNRYLGSSSQISTTSSSIGPSTAAVRHHHTNKKRPISPEQVIRLFGTSSTSASAAATVPTNYYRNGARDRGRQSPASSPPSTTHQVTVEIDSFGRPI